MQRHPKQDLQVAWQEQRVQSKRVRDGRGFTSTECSHLCTDMINSIWYVGERFLTFILKTACENGLVVLEEVVTTWQRDIETR